MKIKRFVLQKVSFSNKEKNMKKTKNKKTTAVSTRNNEAHLMISEGSCDTEDWNNDAENWSYHHRNKLTVFYFDIFMNLF